MLSHKIVALKSLTIKTDPQDTKLSLIFKEMSVLLYKSSQIIGPTHKGRFSVKLDRSFFLCMSALSERSLSLDYTRVTGHHLC